MIAVHEVAASHWTGDPILYPEDRTEEETAHQVAEEALAAAAGKLGGPGPASVAVRAVSGIAAQELIRRPSTLTCWWSARVAAADSPPWLWARPAARLFITRTARSSSCHETANTGKPGNGWTDDHRAGGGWSAVPGRSRCGGGPVCSGRDR